MNITPGTHYLITRIAELEAAMSQMVEQAATKDARIADLEKNQKRPRAVNDTPPKKL